MKLPSLSVILPNYNHGKLLPVAVEAILKQSVQPTELIIIDDGSTDNSVEVIKDLACRSPIIKLYQNDRNRGVSYTLNRGIDLALSDYLFFPGADDEVLPGFLQKSLSLLAQHPHAGLSCAIGDWREVDTGLRWHMGVGMVEKPSYVSPVQMVNLDRRGLLSIPNHTAILKRTALIEAGKFIPEIRSSSDWFADNVVAFRYGMCVVPEPLAIFNLYPRSYYQRIRDNKTEYRDMLEQILSRLNSPQYQDVAELMREGGSLGFLGPEMLKLVLRRSEYRKFLTPTFLRKNLWHSTKLFGKRYIPAWLGNTYFKLAGYRAKTESTLSTQI